MHFFWNHDKSFQHFIDTAAIASLIYRDMQMLIWCLGGGILRHKPFVFRNNAEQSMLSALNNNDWMNEWMNEQTIEKTHLSHALFLRRTRKACEGLACALTIYLWAVLYRHTITLVIVNSYLPRGLSNLGRGTKQRFCLEI